MKCKIISLFILIIFSINSFAQDADTDPTEAYKNVVSKMIDDLEAFRPDRLKNLCEILNPEEDHYTQTLIYYEEQYALLASGFLYVIETDPNSREMIDTIKNNTGKEHTECINADTCEDKNKCLKTKYDGLLGSAIIIDQILNGSNLKQLDNEAKKFEKKKPKAKKHHEILRERRKNHRFHNHKQKPKQKPRSKVEL